MYGSLEIIEAIKTRLFTEDDGGYVPVESTMALATGAFKVAGEVFASSIVQGGPAPGFLFHGFITTYVMGCKTSISKIKS